MRSKATKIATSLVCVFSLFVGGAFGAGVALASMRAMGFHWQAEYEVHTINRPLRESRALSWVEPNTGADTRG